MNHSFEIHIEPWMLRRAWNAWCFAAGRGWKMLIAFFILAAIVFRLNLYGPYHTATIVVETAMVLVFSILLMGYVQGLRRAQSKSEALMDGAVSFKLTDQTIEMSSSLGSAAFKWSALAEVRRYKNLVLLGFRGAQYSPIPLEQIPVNALKFLAERAQSAGVPVVGIRFE
jgi:hypothetical protein